MSLLINPVHAPVNRVKNAEGVLLLYFLIFRFYLTIWISVNLQLSEDFFTVNSKISFFLLVLFYLFQLRASVREWLFVFAFWLIYLFYQGWIDFDIQVLFIPFLVLGITKSYHGNWQQFAKLVVAAGVLVYLVFLGFILSSGKTALLLSLAMRGLNYFASGLFIVCVLSLYGKKTYWWSAVFSGILLVLINSRSAMVGLAVLLTLKYWKTFGFYVVLALGVFGSLVLFPDFIHKLLFKWGGDNLSDTRLELWKGYLGIAFSGTNIVVPMGLRTLVEPLAGTPYFFVSPSDGLAHAPHNIVVDMAYRLGPLLSFCLLLWLGLRLFFVSSAKYNEASLIVALFSFGCLEPTLGPSVNILSFVFFVFLYTFFERSRPTVLGGPELKQAMGWGADFDKLSGTS